ncbi:hypothetical protein F7734_35115 [Scytonema sp. UIC 10036]|uniref:hypothetical protein n=1 Tax=Scytonema sp. UIC 10036 TaxID=2304196 RepID=UPI0012DADD7F|nr:hypothetical protein [Scytonema sp. UIC 10036]MUG97281.1 hypothetical protein [Scytonema sp. UIC 10036]
MLETENMIYQITSKYPRNKESVSLAIGILEGIDIDTAEGLIESITKLIKSESNEVSNLPIQTKSFNKDFGNHVIVRSQKLRDNSKQLQMRYRENRANSKQLKILYNDFSCRFEALKAHFA